jgi:hypothetical protein
MSLVVDELDKKIADEAKKVEETLVQTVDGRTFGCWGWSVRIFRTPKSQTPPTPAETPKPDNTSEVRSVPVSV